MMAALTEESRSPSPAVSLKDLTVNRGSREVLRQLSLDFLEGSITAVVGVSGVGKTTLISVLNGLLRPNAGTVTFSDFGPPDQGDPMRSARRRSATVFQDHALIDRLTAIDNVLLGLADQRFALSPLPWPRPLRLRAAAALIEVELAHRATTPVAELSGGERQRVAIARALVRRPRLLLGDEPFASVDPALAGRLGKEIRRFVSRDGMTAILVLHQLELALTMADRIVGLVEGCVAFDGSPAAFTKSEQEMVFGLASGPKWSVSST